MPARGGDEPFPLLRRTQLSRFLSDDQLEELQGSCRSISRAAWATLFRQGDEARSLFLVVEGSVELRARPPGRRLYRTIEVVGAGCTVGDEAVLEEAAYHFGARVLEPATLLAIDGRAIDRLVDTHPRIALGIARCSASCLIDTVRRAALLTQAPAEVALRHLLEDLARDKEAAGPAVPIRITHTQLAGLLHVSRETVSRLLGRLEGEGTVELRRGVIGLRR